MISECEVTASVVPDSAPAGRKELRARQEIRCAFWRERRAGRCKPPRRRRCGDIVEERQRRRCPPAAAPPRAAALMPGKLLKFAGYVSIGHEATAKCQIILARALSTYGHKYGNQESAHLAYASICDAPC